MISLKVFGAIGTLAQLALALPSTSLTDASDTDAAFLDYLTNTDPSNVTITPGPGLPSLEDLGFTVADLFDSEWRAAKGLYDPRNSGTSAVPRSPLIQKRYDSQCQWVGPRANKGGAYACRDYLNSLGTTQCAAYGQLVSTIFCQASYDTIPTLVKGMPAYPLNQAASYCQDVSPAIQWAIDHCSCGLDGNTCQVSGSCAAYGNGNLIITTTGSD